MASGSSGSTGSSGARLGLALFAAALAGCATNGGNDVGFAQHAALVEGIYRVDSHVLNAAACEPGGAPIEDMHRFAFAKRGAVFGTELLQVWSCASLEDCRAKAALDQLTGPISFSFTLTGVDGGALTGEEATTGYTDGGPTCAMPELSALVLELAGDALTIERAIQVGEDYPAIDGACTTERGRAAAEDAACSKLEVLSATRLEGL